MVQKVCGRRYNRRDATHRHVDPDEFKLRHSYVGSEPNLRLDMLYTLLVHQSQKGSRTETIETWHHFLKADAVPSGDPNGNDRGGVIREAIQECFDKQTPTGGNPTARRSLMEYSASWGRRQKCSAHVTGQPVRHQYQIMPSTELLLLIMPECLCVTQYFQMANNASTSQTR